MRIRSAVLILAATLSSSLFVLPASAKDAAKEAWDKASDPRGLWELDCVSDKDGAISLTIVGGKDGNGFLLTPANGSSGIVAKGAQALDAKTTSPFVFVASHGHCYAHGLSRETSAPAADARAADVEPKPAGKK